MSGFKVIHNERPHYSEVIKELERVVKQGEIRGLALVTLQDDQIYTDFVASDGTCPVELLGSLKILEKMILDQIPRKGEE